MPKKQINTTVYAYDRDGNKLKKHIRANNMTEFVRKKEEWERSLLTAPCFGSVMDEWYQNHEADININTRECYAAPMKQCREQFGRAPVDTIKPLDIDRFLRKLYDDYRYKKQTLKLRLIVLNQVFDFAVLKGYCDNNPCSAVKMPKSAVSGKRDISSPDDIEKIKSLKFARENDKIGMFYYWLLFTGCRRGELLALTYEDISLIGNTIEINKTIVFDGNNPVVQNHPKTDAGFRILPLLSQIKQTIPQNAKGLIFGKNGAYYHKSTFDKAVIRFQKENGIASTPHQLRHAYATILYEAGIQVKDAQNLLGHNSAEVTQNIYQHITEEHQKQTFEALQKYVG